MIAAPLFHSWGFAHFTLGMALSSTLVLNRKFDPEATLSLTAQHEATALVVVPVMIQRILELDDEILDRYDLSELRVVPVSGSALPGALAERWMDLFGDNLYNLYGSTEVAWATIATPEGPARGARHRRASRRAARSSSSTTTTASRSRPGRDRPHLRRQRHAVRGLHGRRQQGRHRRADVLRRRRPLRRRGPPVRRRPRRRHDRLGRRERLPGRRSRTCSQGHDAVAEVAVFGVDDEEFGQRLKAVVVTRKGAKLTEDGRQEARQVQPRRLQGPARRRVRRRAAAQRRPARCSSASSRTTATRTSED